MATSVGSGMHMSSVDDPSPVFAVNGRVDEYSIHSEVRGKTAATVSLSASYECNATLRVGLRLSGGNEREASLQSTPIISPYLVFEREHFFSRLDADFRYSNLSTDRPFPLQAFMILFSAGYRWK